MALSKFLDPQNDVAFRKIFGSEKNKPILIHFINDILKLKNNKRIEEVELLSPIQDPEISFKKESILDVLCRSSDGKQIIVEMQVAPREGFVQRTQYYASKAYCGQLNRGKREDGKYKNLKSVFFIAIVNYILFPNKKNYISYHKMLDENTYENDLKDLNFVFIELKKFKKTVIEELENIIEKWVYFFRYADETKEKDLEKIAGKDLVIEQAYEALNQFNWTENELLLYEDEIKRIRDHIAAEDYRTNKFKKEVEKIKKEFEQGKKEFEQGKKEFEQDKKEALKEGVEKGKLLIAKNMLDKGIDINLIASVTGLTTTKIKLLQKSL